MPRLLLNENINGHCSHSCSPKWILEKSLLGEILEKDLIVLHVLCFVYIHIYLYRNWTAWFSSVFISYLSLNIWTGCSRFSEHRNYVSYLHGMWGIHVYKQCFVLFSSVNHHISLWLIHNFCLHTGRNSTYSIAGMKLRQWNMLFLEKMTFSSGQCQHTHRSSE